MLTYFWVRTHSLAKAGIWWQSFTPIAAVSKLSLRYLALSSHTLNVEGNIALPMFDIIPSVHLQFLVKCCLNLGAAVARINEAEPRRFILGDLSGAGYRDRQIARDATMAGCSCYKSKVFILQIMIVLCACICLVVGLSETTRDRLNGCNTSMPK